MGQYNYYSFVTFLPFFDSVCYNTHGMGVTPQISTKWGEEMEYVKEFFGIGGYTRTPEGAYSWQHLTFAGLSLALMVGLAVWLGLRNRHADEKAKTRVILWAAVLIDGFELIKIAIACYNATLDGDVWYHGILNNLPLFLCSIQLIALPLAAFTRGRLQAASLDFVAVFGLLGAVMGIIGAAQNYNAYPVLGFTNVVSAITHGISGFASLYLLIAGAAPLTKKDMPITMGILTGFSVMAYGANLLLDKNYMFLMAGDGTPYDILLNLVGGSPVWYPLSVMALFFIYIGVFYGVCHALRKRRPVTVSV